MTKQKVNVKEMGYYDAMAHLGIPFFNWGGLKATDELIEMCKVDETKSVLIVGCGSGYQAFHIAKKYGCKVVGVDIAENMVNWAKERAENLNLDEKVEFQYGDAINIPFDDNIFDIVITEFVSIFIKDKDKAFKEYARVLKPSGFVGINEIFKSNERPPEVDEKLKEVEETYEKVTLLDFPILTPKEWKAFFEKAGLVDISAIECEPKQDFKEMVSSVGGKWKFTKLSFKILYYTMTRGPLGKKLRSVGRVKSGFRKCRDYVGYLLCIGKKPI